jgi:hypothetical protein
VGWLTGSSTLQNTEKLMTPRDGVILGISGSVGLAQKMESSLSKIWDQARGRNSDKLTARRLIKNALWSQVEPELKAAELGVKVYGQKALASCTCQTLVALPVQNEPMLIQYDHQCSDEEITGKIPFATIGSGYIQADPFLSFLKKSLWKDQPPQILSQCHLAAIWTLDHVSEFHPDGGVGGTPHVKTLMKVGNDWKVEEMDAGAINMHQQSYKAAMDDLAKFFSPNSSTKL